MTYGLSVLIEILSPGNETKLVGLAKSLSKYWTGGLPDNENVKIERITAKNEEEYCSWSPTTIQGENFSFELCIFENKELSTFSGITYIEFSIPQESRSIINTHYPLLQLIEKAGVP